MPEQIPSLLERQIASWLRGAEAEEIVARAVNDGESVGDALADRLLLDRGDLLAAEPDYEAGADYMPHHMP